MAGKRVQIENEKTGESYDVPLTVFHKEWESKGFRISANEDGTAYEEPKEARSHKAKPPVVEAKPEPVEAERTEEQP